MNKSKSQKAIENWFLDFERYIHPTITKTVKEDNDDEQLTAYVRFLARVAASVKKQKEEALLMDHDDFSFYDLVMQVIDKGQATGLTATNAVGEYMEMNRRVPKDEMDASIERYNKAKENGTLDRDFPRII